VVFNFDFEFIEDYILGLINELIEVLGLIVIGNDLIGYFLDDFIRNNNSESNWFNWCIGCKKYWEIVKKPLAGNLDSMILRLKMMKFQFGHSILKITV